MRIARSTTLPLNFYNNYIYISTLKSKTIYVISKLFARTQNLNIRLKWPNDIYANGSTKIGGLVTTSAIDGRRAVCNLGCGVNLSNSSPTVCINDIIQAYNTETGAHLAPLGYEQLLALTFTELERLLNAVQTGGGDADGLQDFYELYDRLWLHRYASCIEKS